MHKLILAAALSMFASAAHAAVNYVGTRADWNALPDTQKTAYAMGLFDGLTILYTNDSKEDRASKAGEIRCKLRLKLTAADLVTMMDQGYARDITRVSWQPQGVLLSELRAACAEDILEIKKQIEAAPGQK